MAIDTKMSTGAAIIWAHVTLYEEDCRLFFGGNLDSLIEKYDVQLTPSEYNGFSALQEAEISPVIAWLCKAIGTETRGGVCPTFPDC